MKFHDLTFCLCEVETKSHFSAVPFCVMVKSVIICSVIFAYYFDDVEHFKNLIK
jgi:hypothetical protein